MVTSQEEHVKLEQPPAMVELNRSSISSHPDSMDDVSAGMITPPRRGSIQEEILPTHNEEENPATAESVNQSSTCTFNSSTGEDDVLSPLPDTTTSKKVIRKGYLPKDLQKKLVLPPTTTTDKTDDDVVPSDEDLSEQDMYQRYGGSFSSIPSVLPIHENEEDGVEDGEKPTFIFSSEQVQHSATKRCSITSIGDASNVTFMSTSQYSSLHFDDKDDESNNTITPPTQKRKVDSKELLARIPCTQPSGEGASSSSHSSRKRLGITTETTSMTKEKESISPVPLEKQQTETIKSPTTTATATAVAAISPRPPLTPGDKSPATSNPKLDELRARRRRLEQERDRIVRSASSRDEEDSGAKAERGNAVAATEAIPQSDAATGAVAQSDSTTGNDETPLDEKASSRGSITETQGSDDVNAKGKFRKFNSNSETTEDSTQTSSTAYCDSLGEDVVARPQSVKDLCADYDGLKEQYVELQQEFEEREEHLLQLLSNLMATVTTQEYRRLLITYQALQYQHLELIQDTREMEESSQRLRDEHQDLKAELKQREEAKLVNTVERDQTLDRLEKEKEQLKLQAQQQEEQMVEQLLGVEASVKEINVLVENQGQRMLAAERENAYLKEQLEQAKATRASAQPSAALGKKKSENRDSTKKKMARRASTPILYTRPTAALRKTKSNRRMTSDEDSSKTKSPHPTPKKKAATPASPILYTRPTAALKRSGSRRGQKMTSETSEANEAPSPAPKSKAPASPILYKAPSAALLKRAASKRGANNNKGKGNSTMTKSASAILYRPPSAASAKK